MNQNFNMIVKLFIDGKWVKKYLQAEFRHYHDWHEGYKMDIYGVVRPLVNNDDDITELFMQKK
jgi:hypothetical protein